MALVSVVIPSFNNKRTIDACLKSVFGQSHREIECIVVDNFSTDGTVDIVKKYPAILIQAKGERTKAKNIGIGKAQGECICFIDSDMALDKDVLKECLQVIGKGGGGVVIPERSIGKSFWVKVRDFERSFYAGTAIESARFFKADLVRRAGGFDEKRVFFEEQVLPEKIKKMGFSVDKRCGAQISHDENDFSLGKWLGKKYRYGKTASGGKHVSVFYRLGLFLGKKKFYLNPIMALGVLILKFLEFVATVAGRLSG